jgi:hypothetical protein
MKTLPGRSLVRRETSKDGLREYFVCPQAPRPARNQLRDQHRTERIEGLFPRLDLGEFELRLLRSPRTPGAYQDARSVSLTRIQRRIRGRSPPPDGDEVVEKLRSQLAVDRVVKNRCCDTRKHSFITAPQDSNLDPHKHSLGWAQMPTPAPSIASMDLAT